MRGTTGSLDVIVDVTWSDIDSQEGSRANITITFLDPGTEQPHQHQDYDVKISKDGIEVFSAAKQTGQQLLHNVEGTIQIPYEFKENGNYNLDVQVLGLGFPPIPIRPETASFPITITPEFPTTALSAVLLVIAATVLIGRYHKFS